jgi:hypothetical protein
MHCNFMLKACGCNQLIPRCRHMNNGSDFNQLNIETSQDSLPITLQNGRLIVSFVSFLLLVPLPPHSLPIGFSIKELRFLLHRVEFNQRKRRYCLHFGGAETEDLLSTQASSWQRNQTFQVVNVRIESVCSRRGM